MLELLRFEFKRLFKSIFFRIIGIYCIAWPILITVMLRLLLGLVMRDAGISFSELGMGSSEIQYITWLMSVGFVNDLPKFLALFICLHVGRDFTDGIVRNKIIAGHSRTSIFFSYLLVQIAATVALCVVYIGSALLGLFITGIGVNLNGGEMISRWGTAIIILLVLTVTFTVLSLVFRRRAMPIILSIITVVVMSTLTAFVGVYNLPAKTIKDYIAVRDDAYDEMLKDEYYTRAEVEKMKKQYNTDYYAQFGWKFCHPVYLITNLGFNGDYGADAVQLINGDAQYRKELDFTGNFISEYMGVEYTLDGSELTKKDLKKIDSMHISYSTINLMYIGRSLLYILVIGGSGYIIFRKKNLF